MMKETLLINSDPTWRLTVDKLLALYEKHKYVTIDYRLGEDRSLDQNSLFHVWLTEYAAYLLRKDKRDVLKGEVEGMKRAIKGGFYKETGRIWMIHEVINPKNPDQRKRDFTSSKTWKVPEMFELLTWLQATGINDGIVLESKGQFKKLQEKSHGVEAA